MTGPRASAPPDDALRLAAYRRVANALPAILWDGPGVSHVLAAVSDRARDVLGVAGDAPTADPHYWRSHVHVDDLTTALHAMEAVLSTGTTCRITYRFRAAGGAYRWFEDLIDRAPMPEGEVARLVGVMIDVTEESAGRRPIGEPPDTSRWSLEAADAFDRMAEAVVCTDEEMHISYWNPAAERLTGWSACEVLGSKCSAVMASLDQAGNRICGTRACPFTRVMADGKAIDSTPWITRRDGARPAVWMRSAALGAERRAARGCLHIFSRVAVPDVSSGQLTAHDALTGLPGRGVLDALLTARHADLDRHRMPYGFAWVDLDHAQEIAAADGPAALDGIIAAVGHSIRKTVRGGDAVARWQGSTFGVVLAHVDNESLRRAGDRLVRSGRVEVARTSAPVSVSVGLALGKPGSGSRDTAAAAHSALLTARLGGGNRSVVASRRAGAQAPRVLSPSDHRRKAG